jgi:hydrogenase maturation protease
MNEWEWQLLEDKTAVDHLEIAGSEVRTGSRVRLRPRKGGDVMDIALAGQIATIECIEQDYEGKNHVCVVLDSDPGKDMGMLRQPGHRFFFDAEEVEPLSPDEVSPIIAQKPTILIAGIGNIFLGDDAFGVEVVRRLANIELPESVRVTDFGIRGFDLAYALQDGYETTILVDACPHGDAPGTLYVIEPDLKEFDDPDAPQPAVEAHAMNPVNVLRMARAMNIEVKNVLLVGCEPETLGGEEGKMELSDPVEAAVDDAVRLVESIVDKILSGDGPGSKVGPKL